MIKRSKINTLIEPHFHREMQEKLYQINSLPAYKLLTHTRFDIAFKLFFLEMSDYQVEFAYKVYEEHIRAFTLGKYFEPGQEEKNNINKYVKSFQDTYEDMKQNGFDNCKSIIPLSKNGSIANGSHRVASAIYLNGNVDCVNIKTEDHIYDYRFFYSRNVSNEILDCVATKFCEYAPNVYIAILWPIGAESSATNLDVIPNVVYRKEIQLTPNGAHNLLSQVYYGEEWLGTFQDNFKGSQKKLVECFKNFDPFQVVAFQANSLKEVLSIKANIRQRLGVGKHSVHITDTKEESIRVARLIFNDNNLHFLNHAKPNKYLSTFNKIETLKNFMQENNFSNKNFLIDSSSTLALYGLREAKDTDYLCSDDYEVKVYYDGINRHDDELEYHQVNKNELIYDPRYHFYFSDIKFVSFKQLYKMKCNRSEAKDKNDCAMMEALIEGHELKELLMKVRQILFYNKIKIRAKLVNFLKFIKLYDTIKYFIKG